MPSRPMPINSRHSARNYALTKVQFCAKYVSCPVYPNTEPSELPLGASLARRFPVTVSCLPAVPADRVSAATTTRTDHPLPRVI